MHCNICNKPFETIYQVNAHKKVHGVGYDSRKQKTVKTLIKYSKRRSAEFKKQYNLNPRYCLECKTKIPIEKYRADHRVKFCSRSCATRHTNYQRTPRTSESREITSHKLKKYYYKPAKPTIVGPYTKLYRCKCAHCEQVFLSPARIKYCRTHTNLYKSNNRNRYAFTFSMVQYPDLFGSYNEQLKQYGVWSYTNTAGLTRDHKISVTDAIKNNYDPYYIKHPLNCELMSWTDNNKKKSRSSLKYKELVRQVDAYELLNAGEVGIEPTTC